MALIFHARSIVFPRYKVLRVMRDFYIHRVLARTGHLSHEPRKSFQGLLNTLHPRPQTLKPKNPNDKKTLRYVGLVFECGSLEGAAMCCDASTSRHECKDGMRNDNDVVLVVEVVEIVVFDVLAVIVVVIAIVTIVVLVAYS